MSDNNNQNKVVLQTVVTVYENGHMRVDGFPKEFNAAYEMLTNALKLVTEVFLKAALEGRATEGRIEPARIIRPKYSKN